MAARLAFTASYEFPAQWDGWAPYCCFGHDTTIAELAALCLWCMLVRFPLRLEQCGLAAATYSLRHLDVP